MNAVAADQVRLNFDADRLLALNVAIGLLMFGMALDVRVEDFRRVLRAPKAPLFGILAQIVLLPFASYLLSLALRPEPSIALGMILIGACPGGNVSNLMTYLAGGNVALSVSMTAVTTALAVVSTPANLALWGGLNPATAPILRRVSLEPLDVLTTVGLILGLPLLAGMAVAHAQPRLAGRVRGFFKAASVIVFGAIVLLALAANWTIFLQVIGLIALVVALHNGAALLIGYATGRLAGLAPRDVRALTIEVGIQNSGLGLVLVFNFFAGLGGMAIVAAWWGVWHIVSGLLLAGFWSRRPLPVVGD